MERTCGSERPGSSTENLSASDDLLVYIPQLKEGKCLCGYIRQRKKDTKHQVHKP